jgi:hypothetical protein
MDFGATELLEHVSGLFLHILFRSHEVLVRHLNPSLLDHLDVVIERLLSHVDESDVQHRAFNDATQELDCE